MLQIGGIFMISDMQAVFSAVLSVFKLEITLYGFTFSFWNVFLFSIVAGLLLWFVGRLFNDD